MSEQPRQDTGSKPEEGKAEFAFREQYERQIEIMQRLGILEGLDSGELGIKGIDGIGYPLPTQEDIARRMEGNKELVERKQEQGFTQLLLVPFGMKLEDLIKKYEQSLVGHYRDKKLFNTKENTSDQDEELIPFLLNTTQPVRDFVDYKTGDVSGRLVYQPERFDSGHAGRTKNEIIGELGGWRVILLEDMPNIPWRNPETKGGRAQIDSSGLSTKKFVGQHKDNILPDFNPPSFVTGLRAPKIYSNFPSPQEYLRVLQEDPTYKGEEGMTPEDYLMYAIAHLEETNQIIDDRFHFDGDGAGTYQIGAYLPDSGKVPCTFWRRGRSSFDKIRAADEIQPASSESRFFKPDVYDNMLGIRSVVRI